MNAGVATHPRRVAILPRRARVRGSVAVISKKATISSYAISIASP
jgi:hypothetical protein